MRTDIYCDDAFVPIALSCYCFLTTWKHDLRRRQRNDCDPAPRNYYETRLGHSATVRFELCALPADSGYESPCILDRDWLACKRLVRCVGRFARFLYSVLSAGGSSDGCVSVVDPPSLRDGSTSRSPRCG